MFFIIAPQLSSRFHTPLTSHWCKYPTTKEIFQSPRLSPAYLTSISPIDISADNTPISLTFRSQSFTTLSHHTLLCCTSFSARLAMQPSTTTIHPSLYISHSSSNGHNFITITSHNFSRNFLWFIRILHYVLVISSICNFVIVFPQFLQDVDIDVPYFFPLTPEFFQFITQFQITTLVYQLGLRHGVIFFTLLLCSVYMRRNLVAKEELVFNTTTQLMQYRSFNDIKLTTQSIWIPFSQARFFIHEVVHSCRISYALCLCDQNTASLPSTHHTLHQLTVLSKTQDSFPKGPQFSHKSPNQLTEPPSPPPSSPTHQQKRDKTIYRPISLQDIVARCRTDADLQDLYKEYQIKIYPVFFGQQYTFAQLQPIFNHCNRITQGSHGVTNTAL